MPEEEFNGEPVLKRSEGELKPSNCISKLRHSMELKTEGTFTALPSNELLQILECVQANFLSSYIFKCIPSLFV